MVSTGDRMTHRAGPGSTTEGVWSWLVRKQAGLLPHLLSPPSRECLSLCFQGEERLDWLHITHPCLFQRPFFVWVQPHIQKVACPSSRESGFSFSISLLHDGLTKTAWAGAEELSIKWINKAYYIHAMEQQMAVRMNDLHVSTWVNIT